MLDAGKHSLVISPACIIYVLHLLLSEALGGVYIPVLGTTVRYKVVF